MAESRFLVTFERSSYASVEVTAKDEEEAIEKAEAIEDEGNLEYTLGQYGSGELVNVEKL